jgi:hypothetical protein
MLTAFHLLRTSVFVVVAASALASVAPAQEPAAPGTTAAPATTDAEGYKVWIPSATLAKSRFEESRIKQIVIKVLKGEEPLNANQSIFDAFFTKFYFPMRTQTTPEVLADLPAERHRFFRDYMEICKVPTVHAHLCNMTLAQMQLIVDDNFHPVVRYNAMLIIAGLNDQEKVVVGAAPATPEPMLRALPVLLDQLNKPEQTDAIHVAALLGLVRHMEWDNFKSGPPIGAPLKAVVVKALLDLATAKTPPAGRNAEGHEWFRRRAIEGLAHASYARVEPPVAAAMETLLKDETESLPIRCAAAAAIGRMTYQAPVKLDPQATARELGALAVVICDHELNRLAAMRKTEQERAERLSGLGPLGGGGPGGDEGGVRRPSAVRPPVGGDDLLGGGTGLLVEDPKQYRFDPSRRRIRADLYAVQVGLTGGEDRTQTTRGVEKLAKTPAEKAYVGDVKKAVDGLAKSVEEAGGLDLATLEKDLRIQMKALEGITKKAAPPAVPAAEAEVPAPPGIAPPGIAPPGVPAPPPGVPAAPAPPVAAPTPPGVAPPR